VADPPAAESNFQSFWIAVSLPFPLDREGLLAYLASPDISARRGIMAAHRPPSYKGHPTGPLPITEPLTDHPPILPVTPQTTADSRYGSARQAKAATMALATQLGVIDRIMITTEREAEHFAAADVITNSGHVRPVRDTLAAAIRPDAVLSLMFESWEAQVGRL